MMSEAKTECPAGWICLVEPSGRVLYRSRHCRPLLGTVIVLMGCGAFCALCPAVLTSFGQGLWAKGATMVFMDVACLAFAGVGAYFVFGHSELQIVATGFRYYSGVLGMGRRINCLWKDVREFKLNCVQSTNWSGQEPERMGLSDVRSKWHQEEEQKEPLEHIQIEVHRQGGAMRLIRLRTRLEGEFFLDVLSDCLQRRSFRSS